MALGAAIFSAAICDGAVAQMPDGARLIPNFDAQTIAPVMQAAGASVSVTPISGEASALRIETDGLVGYVVPRACRNETANCAGGRWLISFSGNVNRDAAMRFNQLDFIKVVQMSNGAWALTRYDIADYGVPQGNLVVTAGVFFAIAKDFQSQVYSSGGTSNDVSFEVDDRVVQGLNASALNAVNAQISATRIDASYAAESRSGAIDDAHIAELARIESLTEANGPAIGE